MYTIVFILVIGNIINYYITYLTATGKLVDKRRKLAKQLTKKGWIFTIISLTSVLVSVLQFYLINKTTNTEQDKRDKIAAEKNEAKADSVKNQIIRVLGEYNLRYNNSQKRIESLVKDSIKPIIIDGEFPTITLGSLDHKEIEITPDKKHFLITIISNNATATDINLKFSFVVSNNQYDFIYDNKLENIKSVTVAKDQGIEAEILKDSTRNYNYFTMWARGTYKNQDKTKLFLFNEMITLNNKNNETHKVLGFIREKIINIITVAEKKNKSK